MKILHIITNLADGGAETMLLKLLSATDQSSISSVVVSLINKGQVGNQMESLGIPVIPIRMKSGVPSLRSMKLLKKIPQKYPVDIIQGWMYHGNLAAKYIWRHYRDKLALFWNIRHSIADIRQEKLSTRFVIRICALLSHRPQKIIYNSYTASRQHEEIGYAKSKTIVIANGFDTTVFRPSKTGRLKIRQELQVSDQTPLVGLIARYHPVKDHANFIRAARIVSNAFPDVHFICAGKNITFDNFSLKKLINNRGLITRFHLLGERSDTPRLMAALDIMALSSFGEGFPNVLGEAMACGIPCVATNVGDSAYAVGKNGVIVPPGHSEALAEGIISLLEKPKHEFAEMKKNCRARIKKQFSLSAITKQYEQLYINTIQKSMVDIKS